MRRAALISGKVKVSFFTADEPLTRVLSEENPGTGPRIASLDVQAAKHDVLPFVRKPEALAIWSRDYFLALAEKVVCTVPDPLRV